MGKRCFDFVNVMPPAYAPGTVLTVAILQRNISKFNGFALDILPVGTCLPQTHHHDCRQTTPIL